MAEINYDITIDDTKQFVIELNEQGPQGARGYDGPPGADGIGINRIYKDSTSGLVDTYNIEYTNGNTTSFTVTNGNGIYSIELTDTEDLTDTYTITFDNGDTTTFEVENGKGITSITGPVTVDNVDTYTINFNDGTDTTFNVTNGIDGYSPTASVVKSGNKATITITDKNGTTTADIYDGSGSVADVLVNGTSVLDGQDAKILLKTINGVAIEGSGNISTLENTATQSTSLALLTSSTNDKNNTVALGYNSVAGGYMGIAIGSQASVTKTNGIQIGYGTNNEANSLYVATSTSDNWKMLDSNGLIPDARLSSNIARTSSTLPSSTKYGADLSYTSNTLQLLDQDGNSLGNTVTIQSSPNIDNTTITKNSSDELQTVAVIDNRSGNAIKTWTGTKAQYDALTTKDSTTLYNITDDTDTTLTLLNLLYPVGSIYIGTMANCPLQALGVGTWQLVATDRVLQGATDGSVVGTTKEAGLPNITGSVQGVVDNNAIGWRNASGLFKLSATASQNNSSASNYNRTLPYTLYVDVSQSNSIYGNSNTVQPPAYLVNIWERIS